MSSRHRRSALVPCAWLLALWVGIGPVAGQEDGHDPGHGEKHEGHGHEGEPQGDGHAEDHADVVRLTPEARAAAGIKLEPAAPARLSISLELPGEIALNADRTAHLTPRVGGTATAVHKSVGDAVAAGEVLVVLSSPDLGRAKIDYFTAQQAVVQAEFERGIAQGALEVAQLERERARTVHDNTKRLLDSLVEGAADGAISKELSRLPIGESKGKLLAAAAELRQARAAHAREQDLFQRQVSSEAELELARRNLESAQAAYDALFEEIGFGYRTALLEAEKRFTGAQGDAKRAELACANAHVQALNAERRLHILGLTEAQVTGLAQEKDEQVSRYELRAPFAGVVIDRHVTLGEVLAETDVCFEISDLSVVWVDVSVYPKHLSIVRVDAPARVVDPASGSGAEGKVARITPVIRQTTRQASATVLLPNPDRRWIPGSFARVLITVADVEVPVSVPSGAIVDVENRPCVFVEEDGAFEARPVKTGRDDGRRVEILRGLRAGEPVVVENAMILKMELGKAEAGHDHAH